MKLADANVWLALALSGHRHHALVSRWLAGQDCKQAVVFCRFTQLSTLKLLTTAAVLGVYGSPPLTNEAAWCLYGRWLSDPRIGFVVEPPGLDRHWLRLGGRQSPSPKLWMDAYLAAFAIAGGHQLVTIDKAFSQFADLDLSILTP